MKKSFMKIISAAMALSLISMPYIPIKALSERAAEEEIIYGDATCNGEVDIRDVSAIAQHIVKIKPLSEQGIRNCNFFGMGKVDIKSLSVLKRYMIGDTETLEQVSVDDMIEFSQFVTEFEDYCFSENSSEQIFTDYEAFRDYVLDIYFDNSNEDIVNKYAGNLLAEYDSEFFSENVLFIKRITVGSSNCDLTIKSIDTDINGNYIMNVNYTVYDDDDALRGCFAGFAVPKSNYSNQTFRMNLKNYDNACAIAEENAFITPLDTYYDSSMATQSRAFTEYAGFESYISTFRYGEELAFAGFLDKYDEEFFEDNVLFIRRIGFGSSGHDLSVNSVTRYANGNFSMNIDDNYPWDMPSCCVMTGCFAGFTLPKSEYNNELFTADIHNTHDGSFTSGIITEPQ